MTTREKRYNNTIMIFSFCYIFSSSHFSPNFITPDSSWFQHPHKIFIIEFIFLFYEIWSDINWGKSAQFIGNFDNEFLRHRFAGVNYSLFLKIWYKYVWLYYIRLDLTLGKNYDEIMFLLSTFFHQGIYIYGHVLNYKTIWTVEKLFK